MRIYLELPMAGIMTGVGRYAGSSMAILVLGLAVFVYSTFDFPPRPQSWRLASSIENGGIYLDLPLKEIKPVNNCAAEAQKFLFNVVEEGVYTEACVLRHKDAWIVPSTRQNQA